MNEEKEAGSVATDEPRPTEGNFTERFNDALKAWRAEGCSQDVPNEDGSAVARCNGRPHGTKIEPADADGNVTMVIACEHGHERSWEFKVAEVEMKAELARQAAAAAQAEKDGGKTRDPMKASVTITLDLKTQEVRIDPWVPNPGVGIQLAGMLMSHFFAQLQMGAAPANARLKLPPKGIINPKTGKLMS